MQNNPISILVGLVAFLLVMAHPASGLAAEQASKVEASGRVHTCEFSANGFHPRLLKGDDVATQTIIAAGGHIDSVFQEKTAVTNGIRLVLLTPALREQYLPDDPKGTIVKLFADAYERLSADPGFEGARSALPHFCKEAGEPGGHGFIYLPYHRPGAVDCADLPPIVFLHGYGGNLMWNLWALKTEFPDRIILAPSGGIGWPKDGDAALKYVDGMRDYVCRKFDIRLERPWLMALSQGGSVASRMVTKSSERFRGYVSIASWMDGPAKARYPTTFPTLMIAGTNDKRVTLRKAESDFNDLKLRGAQIELKSLTDADHFFFLARRQEMGRLIKAFFGKWEKNDTKPAARPFEFKDCPGKYRWQTSDGTIDFDLEWDGTFTAVQTTDTMNLPEGAEPVKKGKGTWSVRGARLTVTMTHALTMTIWKEQRVTWINDEEIAGTGKSGITLKTSKPLVFR